MSVFKSAVGSSDPKFRKIPDCEMANTSPVGDSFPCETMSSWIVINERTKERKLCCSKHLTKALNKTDPHRVLSITLSTEYSK